jgi:RimJ/RimL family protein N-acetyltransferase
MAAPNAQGRSAKVVVRPLRRRDRATALARLAGRGRDDLFLLDLAQGLGETGDAAPELLGAWRGDALVGLASLRPTVVIESALEPAVREALIGPLSDLASGLVRSEARVVAALWSRLARRGRRALVDRLETMLVLAPARFLDAPTPAGVAIQPAVADHLEPLVDAARASLREEGRPDPFLGDPRGFRRWVAARLSRARVALRGHDVVWVGYADVRIAQGHLLQGVYTWPAWRRQGLAAAGVSALCREAFAQGAEHVQLSVVEGNDPALALYAKLGFHRHGLLRTILFV